MRLVESVNGEPKIWKIVSYRWGFSLLQSNNFYPNPYNVQGLAVLSKNKPCYRNEIVHKEAKLKHTDISSNKGN